MSDMARLMSVVMPIDRSPYRGYRFPPEIIAHAVWLYFRFHLSFRDVQDLLADRGVIVSHESIRQWCTKFGAAFAGGLRRRRVRAGDKWHLDEVLLKINSKRHWLWRAVDQNGVVLDILVQSRRDQQAAERFLRQVVDGVGYEPRVVITDKLASYPPAIHRVLPNSEHRRHKGLNNRAENSHLPTRSESGCFSASNQPSTPSASWDRSAPLVTISVRDDTSSLLPLIDRSALSVTPSGGTSPWAECAHETLLSELTHAFSCPPPPSNSSS
jgi:putative transposase